MIDYTTNKCNTKFLLLFGVFFYSQSIYYTQADPVFSIYKNKVNDSSHKRAIAKKKNSIYLGNFKKLRAKDSNNGLYNKIKGKNINSTYGDNIYKRINKLNNQELYHDSIHKEIKGIIDDQEYKNIIHKRWNLTTLQKSLNAHYNYMEGYRSRLFPFFDSVFYDCYLSEMNKSKKSHHSFKKFLNQFRLHFSTGFGYAFVKSCINGYFFEKDGNYFLSPIFQNGDNDNYAYQMGWFGETYKKVANINSSSYHADKENAKQYYVGHMVSVPLLTMGFSYDIYKRLRFELDYTLRQNYLKTLNKWYQESYQKNNIFEKSNPSNIDTISIPKSTFFNSELGLLVGYKVINNTFWSLIFNFKSFLTFIHKGFNIVDGNFVHGKQGVTPGIGLGFTIEKHLSDFTTLFARGMFEVEKFGWIKDQQNADEICSANHSFTKGTFNFGVNFTIPYIEKCEQEDCKIKEIHIHNNQEYRGLPVYKYISPYGKVIHGVKED